VLRDQNSIDHLKEVYNHDYVITLDELPNIQAYLEDSQLKKITSLIDGCLKTGDLSGPAYVQVTNSFKQVQDQYNKGHHDQAINHLQKLQKHLNNIELPTISNDAKQVLLSNSDELIHIFSE